LSSTITKRTKCTVPMLSNPAYLCESPGLRLPLGSKGDLSPPVWHFRSSPSTDMPLNGRFAPEAAVRSEMEYRCPLFSAQRTQVRHCDMSEMCPGLRRHVQLGKSQRLLVSLLVQGCRLQSAIQRRLTQFQVSGLCRRGVRSQPPRGQLRLNPDGGAYPFLFSLQMRLPLPGLFRAPGCDAAGPGSQVRHAGPL
jgi:hypothetical protein